MLSSGIKLGSRVGLSLLRPPYGCAKPGSQQSRHVILLEVCYYCDNIQALFQLLGGSVGSLR